MKAIIYNPPNSPFEPQTIFKEFECSKVTILNECFNLYQDKEPRLIGSYSNKAYTLKIEG